MGTSRLNLADIPFGVTDWATVPVTEHAGEAGTAWWQTVEVGTVRLRRVVYSPGYLADHWCQRGHVLLVLAGELHTELEDGRNFVLSAGMNYQVQHDGEAHRSSTPTGATLFIVD